MSYNKLRATGCHHIVDVGLGSTGLSIEERGFQCCVCKQVEFCLFIGQDVPVHVSFSILYVAQHLSLSLHCSLLSDKPKVRSR